MVDAAVVPIRPSRPCDPLQGLDTLTALNLFRDTRIRPDFRNVLNFDAHGPISAMPLVVLLLRKHEARLVSILATGLGGRERLAQALRMPVAYVWGYFDGWFGDRPAAPLTDAYVLGYSQGSDLRDLILAHSLMGVVHVDQDR